MMMKKFLTVASALLLVCLSVLGQEKTNEQIISEIVASSAEMTSFSCDIRQSRMSKIINGKLSTDGRMYYLSPDKIRMEYSGEKPFTMVMSSDAMMMERGGVKSVVDVRQNKMFKGISTLLEDCISGSMLLDDKNFSTIVARQGGEYVVELLPQTKQLQKIWVRMVLRYNIASQYVSVIEMYEKSGDSTIIELRNIKKNIKLDDQLFAIEQ